MASGLNRTINRRKFQRSELDEMLSDPSSISARVFQRLKILLKIRREHPAFHPYGSQEVLASVPEVFCLQRTSPDGKEQVLCLQNVNNRSVQVDRMEAPGKWTYDLIENNKLDADFPKTLKPYQTMWLIEHKD
jgi:sucrose phosphorylase